ncbi:hypothetical protein QR77_25220 [Streptomyces sp. 150FB]|nr:hypothetical protein QR77_25220 [Streptomyces sp. 150FB]
MTAPVTGPCNRHPYAPGKVAVRRATSVRLMGTGLAMGALFVLAPVGVTPKGCGDLTGGRLCVEGPIGRTGGFTVRYIQRPARTGEVTVRLGYQRKDARITAFAGWFGTERTRDGRAELSGRLDTAPGECIRGVLLDSRTRPYVTRWSCSH